MCIKSVLQQINIRGQSLVDMSPNLYQACEIFWLYEYYILLRFLQPNILDLGYALYLW